jgi:hypothetical protein
MVSVSATSDAEGNYSIDGLRLGTRVELTAQAKRFGHKDANVTLTRGKAVVEQPTLVLKPANSVVTGSVLDTSGRPMAGIEVSLYGEQTAWQQIKTNDAGEFEAADIVDGEKISVQVKVGNRYLNGGDVMAGMIGAVVVAKE